MEELAHDFRVGDSVKFTGTWDSIAHVRLLHDDKELELLFEGDVGVIVNESAYGTGSHSGPADKTDGDIYPLVMVEFEWIDTPVCLGVNHLTKVEHGSSSNEASRRDA